ncbi:ankyrin repeat domain-containing protein 33B isoform X4 [Meriones unguiculatus]|uniref:ankyrin repeat domain-containing protein 33B isoform X4 n=1 Tax=Meriones unguiculatus TaxID=10047 RepID=UPI00293ECCA5|nr:ankyrin repeat domain-containing protein 33B isoform X4 [Meriones unguiculatus]
MVLLAGPGPEGGGTRCLAPQPPTPPRGVQTGDDPTEYEEYEDFSSLPDTRSIASDDSFYPPGGEEECGSVSAESVQEGVPEAATLLRAACANDVGLLRALVRRGPSSEEVRETDRNGRTGLIVACYHGFVDAVVALAECPHVDVNWQDSEGNTALITAAQAAIKKEVMLSPGILSGGTSSLNPAWQSLRHHRDAQGRQGDLEVQLLP